MTRHNTPRRSSEVRGGYCHGSHLHTFVPDNYGCPETLTHVRPVTPMYVPRPPLYLDHVILTCSASISNVFILNTHSYAYIAFSITTSFSILYSGSCLLRNTFLFQLVRVAYIQNLVEYIITNVVCCKFSSLFLAINSLSRLLNICLSQLANPFYIKNIYYTFILVVPIPFNCILVKQGLNYSNTLFIKNNPIQATYFITVGSPSPLLVILILVCVRNPLNL